MPNEFDYDGAREAFRNWVKAIKPAVSSGVWVNWEGEDQQKLNTALHAMDKMFTKTLRPEYDQALYAGQDNGKVRAGLLPIRKRTVKDTPETVETTIDDEIDALFAEEVETDVPS